MSNKNIEKYINFNSYSVACDETKELLDTLDSGWITTGPKTKKFEEQFAEYVKAKYAVGVTSGTAALHLSLLSLGIGKGDEVITTPMTFVATVNAILYVGAYPVLADVEPHTLNIDPEQIKRKITKKTRAIIPVHYAGQPCKMGEIIKIAKKNGLFIIQDAAHAIEAEYEGKKIGSIGHLACFSFHPIKNITTGEGGMVTTNNSKLADKIRVLRLHGMDKGAWKRYEKSKFRHWDMKCLGYKYNMTDMQASLGIHQLKKIDMFWKIRKEYAERYNAGFKEEKNIILLPPPGKNKNAYHLYPIRIKTENLKANRDSIIDMIQSRNIGLAVHFRAVHLSSFYKKYFGFKKGKFPNAEYASERLISLPLYPKMSKEEVDYVVENVKDILLQEQINP